ncbi:natriuretic peptides A-like [Tiliqua scincoides]|uniref:natriuretic peptides A-like n=1 Tax=Tiliqua scincoides TaxID=71010 RepID=UPI0034628506
MGATIPVLLVLFFASQLPEQPKAHPVYGSELADFKALLERLEDKLEPEDRDSGLTRRFNEPSEDMAGDIPQTFASWDGEYPRPESEQGFGRDHWQPPERAPVAEKNRLRGLFNSPRSLQRSSNCFGQRLDRVGSTSGLGCNRIRSRS